MELLIPQASFDHKGDGQLNEAEFERAVISMALGLSDQEIREVRDLPAGHPKSCACGHVTWLTIATL